MTGTVPKKWAKPTEVDDVTLVFPANVIGTYLPNLSDIPEAFREETTESWPWRSFFSLMFGAGLGIESKFYLREGVDGETALRHLRAVMGSYEPKHEHKEAGFAWLASLWFHGVEYTSPADPGKTVIRKHFGMTPETIGEDSDD